MSLVRSGDVVGATPRTGPSLKESDVAELRNYAVVVNGYETTMQLTAEDAKELGAKLADDPAEKEQAKAVAEPPKNKARSPRGK